MTGTAPTRTAAIGRTARIFDRACKLDSRTEAVLAATMEVSVTLLRAWGDPTSGKRAPMFALALLEPEAMIQATRELLIDLDHAVVELPSPSTGPCDLDLLMTHQREASDVLVAGLCAVKAGRLDRVGGAQLERECNESIEATLRVRELARAAQRDGVAKLPSIRPRGEA